MIYTQPIFKEQIKMWSDMGYDIPIQEGMYWLDRGIIKGFTSDGELHNLYKYKVNDDLSICIYKHKDFKDLDFETWQETVKRMEEHLNEIETDSVEIVSKAIKDYSDYDFWCLTSTGKDSTVALSITQKVVPNVNVVFHNTSLDCADTYKLVKTHPEWVVTNPKEGFYQWVNRLDFIPKRFSRACCTVFKEGIGDKFFVEIGIKKLCLIMGIRNDESNTRANRQDVETFPRWKSFDTQNWRSVNPIRKFTDLDVWLYIFKNNLEINSKYRKGYSRVGCQTACPFYTKTTWVLDKYWYQSSYERWRNILRNHFVNNYEWIVMNCTSDEFVNKCWNAGTYRKYPTEEVYKEFAEKKGVNLEIAKKYFVRYCANGCLNRNKKPLLLKEKDVLAMNMKLFGRNINKFLCKKCLMKEMGWTKEQWNEQVEGFKLQGCKLF